MNKGEEKEKRIKRLLNEGIHVIDSGANLVYCPVTGKVAECKPRELVNPCQICGRHDLTGQII